MNYALRIFVVVIIARTFVTPVQLPEVKRLKVVSGFDLAHVLYERIRLTKKQSSVEPTATDIDSFRVELQRTCEDILGDVFFGHSGKCSYEKPQQYVEADSPDVEKPSKPDAFADQTNVDIKVNFYAKSYTVDESVFVCSCQTTGVLGLPLKVKKNKYYVSNEYNFSEEPDTRIAGRFVFVENGGRILPRAIAEEAARVKYGRGYDLEHHYLEIRGKKELAKKKTDDPLCRVRLEVKLRICKSVFNSDHFHEELTFEAANVGGSCDKKEVTFRTQKGKAEQGDRKFDEWAMHCQPNQDDVDFNYYLGQSYGPDELFVYTWDKYENKLVLENLSTAVRIRDFGFFLNYADNAP